MSLKRNYKELSKVEKLKDLKQSYEEMASNILHGSWGGSPWFEGLKIVNRNKISAYRYQGYAEAMGHAIEILLNVKRKNTFHPK